MKQTAEDKRVLELLHTMAFANPEQTGIHLDDRTYWFFRREVARIWKKFKLCKIEKNMIKEMKL